MYDGANPLFRSIRILGTSLSLSRYLIFSFIFTVVLLYWKRRPLSPISVGPSIPFLRPWYKMQTLSPAPPIFYMVTAKLKNFFAPMIAFTAALFLLSRFLEFPPLSLPLQTKIPSSYSLSSFPSSSPLVLSPRPKEAFSNLKAAFAQWDAEVGCARFREVHSGWAPNFSAVQGSGGEVDCEGLGSAHVSVLVKEWTWIPDNLNNLYSCQCGMSCLWTKSPVMVDKPDALLFESAMPPATRRKGDPFRVYIDLEVSRKRSGFEDIFVGYHASDDVQSTYAGSMFHSSRNYLIASHKLNDTLVYWSSSRCLGRRNELAREFLARIPHHSFGKCLNNVGGLNVGPALYPECSSGGEHGKRWWDHLHCVMSRYKFVLAIENTVAEGYVTEKLFYALDVGAVPIYMGAPDVWDLVPPNSIVDASRFGSVEELASYVRAVADDPVAYAQFHAWRRCGVLGNYGRTRAASLDTLPCRLCALLARKRRMEARSPY